jgi:hypothetical protein
MRCPNCGHENPEGTLFCEECDWRIDQAVRMKLGVNSVYLAYISLALGAVAAIASFAGFGIAGVPLGAVGMFLGGYCLTAVRMSGIKGRVKTTLMVMVAVAIILSILGFIYSLTVL